MIVWIYKVVKSAIGSACCIFFASSLASAQSNPTIRSGRPGQAIGAYTVGMGWLQFQSGIDRNMQSDVSRTQETTANNVVRLGLTETFEFSLLFNYSDISTRSGIKDFDRSGFSKLHLGFRTNVIDRPDGWIPGLGFQLRFKTTEVGEGFRAPNLAPVFLAVTHHKLADGFDWVHNLGASWDGSTSLVQYNYISNFSFSLSDKWSGFVELFGNQKGGRDLAYGDMGVAFLMNSDLQFDLSGGWGQNYGVAEVFASIGISWRTQTLGPKVL